MIPDLPSGYKERMDIHVLALMPHAQGITELCGEFCCETVELSDGDITVTIQPNRKPEK